MIPRPLSTAALLALTLGGPAWAQAEEGPLQRLTVTPGRTFDAPLIATEGDGFRIAVPSGSWLVPFDAVEAFDDLPADAEPAPFPTWNVLVLAEDTGLGERLVDLVDAMPGLVATLPEGLDRITRRRVETCAGDRTCIGDALPLDAWWWIVRATGDGNEVTLSASSPGWPALRATLAAPPTADALDDATREALGLDAGRMATREQREAVTAWRAGAGVRTPPTPPPSTQATVPSPTRPPPEGLPRARVTALGFVPVPGLPSAVQGDWAGFGTALAVGAGATAGWVAATGRSATRRGEHIALGVVGAYALTVATNQIFGHHPLSGDARRTQVAAAVAPPSQGQGAVLQLVVVPGGR